MDIREFAVERWMDAYENHCEFNLAESCVDSLRFSELLELSGEGEKILREMTAMKLTYGAIEGSLRLRTQIASLYTQQRAENVTIAHGAAGANALVYETLIRPGDHVISFVPTYQQHYSIAEAYGASVERLQLREQNGYLPDIDELRSRVLPGTRLIVFSNPNNPTGSLMDRAMLEQVVDVAREVSAYVLSDEVYRGVDLEGDGFTASVADVYDRGISTGSMSKAYSLAGLRLGWIVAPHEFLKQVTIHRHYNTISVGMIDDLLAAVALEHREKILARSRAILRANLAILDNWIEREPLVSYVKPKAGTTTLVKIALPIPSEELCLQLLRQKGVLFMPGSAMEMEGHVRIGFANATRSLELGLPRVSEFLHSAAIGVPAPARA